MFWQHYVNVWFIQGVSELMRRKLCQWKPYFSSYYWCDWCYGGLRYREIHGTVYATLSRLWYGEERTYVGHPAYFVLTAINNLEIPVYLEIKIIKKKPRKTQKCRRTIGGGKGLHPHAAERTQRSVCIVYFPRYLRTASGASRVADKARSGHLREDG